MPADPHLARNVCTELAAAISEHEWADPYESVEASFRRMADYGLEDLGTLKISIVPGQIQVNQDDRQPRGADFFEVTVSIVMAKHVGTEGEISDLEDLNLQIVDAIRSYHLTLANIEHADWTDISISMPFDPQSLADRNVFLSQTDVTFWIPRDKLPAPTE
jgi:hypothetical protein